MSIYGKLKDILAERAEETWKVSFAELERLMGAKLPASAFKYPGWWSNNPSNNAMTKIWLQAGFRTEKVDIPGQTVVFRRAPEGAVSGFRDRQRPWEGPPESWVYERKSIGPIEENKAEAARRLQRLRQGQLAGDEDMFEAVQLSAHTEAGLGRPVRFEDFYGALKGLVAVAPGIDLTAPSDEQWEALKDE